MSPTPSSGPTTPQPPPSRRHKTGWLPLVVWFGFLLAQFAAASYDPAGDGNVLGEAPATALTLFAFVGWVPLFLLTGMLVRDRYRARALEHPKSRAAGAVAAGAALSILSGVFAMASPYTHAAILLAALAGTAGLGAGIWAMSGDSRRRVAGVLGTVALCAAGAYGVTMAFDGVTGWQARHDQLAEATSRVSSAHAFDGPLYWFPNDPYTYPIGDAQAMFSYRAFAAGEASVRTYAYGTQQVNVCEPSGDTVCVDVGDRAVLTDRTVKRTPERAPADPDFATQTPTSSGSMETSHEYRLTTIDPGLEVLLIPAKPDRASAVRLAGEVLDALERLDPNAMSARELARSWRIELLR